MFLGICRFASIFFGLLHTFVNYDTFSYWGEGNAVMISVSAVELGCAAYTYAMAHTTDISFLSTLYNLKGLYLALVGLVMLPVGVTTIMTLYAYQQSDQLASFTISSNVLKYCLFTIFPFLSLVVLTIFLCDMRKYDIDNSELEFDKEYHYGPKQASRKNQGTVKK